MNNENKQTTIFSESHGHARSLGLEASVGNGSFAYSYRKTITIRQQALITDGAFIKFHPQTLWYFCSRRERWKILKACFFSCLSFFAVLLIASPGAARASVGANTPFVSYEAESGFLGGGATIYYLTNSPTTQYSSPEVEASGHSYVALINNGQYVQWTNNTGQNITAINLRSCVPDAPAGNGISNTIDLYINGTFRQAFSVNSMQNYCYEGTNYNGQTDKNPADGDPRDFWNDTHAFVSGAAIAPGSTFGFQMDSTNSAAFYYIDVVDLENPPAPLTQPANSLSITSYGAVSNNPSFDNTSAMNSCFAAAQSQGKVVWIPAGTWYISAIHGGLNATGVTIEGAGPWYTTICRVTPANNTLSVANIINSVSCTLSNVLLDCNSWSRDGANNNGAVDFSGTNWAVNNVWIQHTTSSFWCAGVNGIVENCRTLSTWADGGNFNNVQSDNGIGENLTYSNNFVRGTGDDAMAINSGKYTGSPYYTIMSNIKYCNNTAIEPWGGKCMGIYGGSNDVVANNLLEDTARYLGLGVMRFGVNGSDLLSATVIGNTLLRCGGNGYNQQQQAMMIGNGGDSQGVGTVENAYVVSNTIVDALYDAVGFSTSTNIVLEYNTIIAPGLNGIVAGPPDLGSSVLGFAVLNFNTITGFNSGYSGFLNNTGGYLIGGVGNTGFTVPGPVPNPWSSQDIGAIPISGGASYNNGIFTLVGSGNDISGTNDVFHYVYQNANGDYSILAEVDTEEIANPAAKAGLMLRNSLDPADLEASVLVTPGNGILFKWRGVYGGATSSLSITNVAAPYWIQLTRMGNTFAAYCSSNQANWVSIGTAENVSMNTNAFAGLAVTSHTNSMLCSSMIGNVTTPSTQYSAVHCEGDLIANVQSANLNSSSKVWTNQTSNINSVGNFSTIGGANLNVASLAYGSSTIKALFVNQNGNSSVQSSLQVPLEIAGNNPASVEAWIYPLDVNQTSSYLNYGYQGGSSSPMNDREYNFDASGHGIISGDFGALDTGWATTLTSNTWHYVAVTYDGTNLSAYLDGSLNVARVIGTPIATVQTLMEIGSAIGGTASSGGNDPFHGYIACARAESGVLTASDIANNYVMGPLGTPAAITPGGLVAVSGDGQVQLSWNASGNASEYNVKRSSSINGTYNVIAANVTGLAYTNTGLTDGVTYYYEVSGVNDAGESANSAPVTAQPVSLTRPVFNVAISGGQIQLTWPQDHAGWSLEEQTNGLGIGLGTNWVKVTGSTLTNQVFLPINPANHTAFFRLAYP